MDINKKLTEQLKSQELKNSVTKNETSQVLVINPTVKPTTENQGNKNLLNSGKYYCLQVWPSQRSQQLIIQQRL